MAHNLPINSAMHEASVLFAKKIKEKTKNKVQIEIFPSQQLGNDHKMVELARAGKIDILLTPTAKMSVPVPSMQYADMPFLFPSREDAYELLDGEPGQMILDDLNNIDLFGVTFWENGFKHFTGNKPFLEPKDFKGEKIRVMKSRIIMEQFKALDAEPIPIDFHATRKALKDRVVDGQENPLVAIVNMVFHEVQSDLTISEHAYLPYVLSISKKTLTKLPIDIGEILIQTAKDVTPWERAETQKREEAFLEIVRKADVDIHVLDKQQKQKFVDATKYIIKMYEDIIGPHIVSKTQEILDKKYNNENYTFIGLDADLSMAENIAGLAIKRGIELAIDEINAAGGLLGKKVGLIAKDHKAISTQAKKNIKEFIDNPNVVAIIGGKHSAVVSSEIKEIQQAKIPFISSWAAASKITENGYDDNYMFRVSLSDKYSINFLIKETFKKYKRPVVVVENSIWGRDGLELIKTKLKEKGMKLSKGIVVNRGEEDFKTIINEIKKENADSIILIMNSIEGSKLVNTMGENNYNLPIVSHWGIVGGNFFEKNKKYLKNIDLEFIQTFSFLNSSNEIAKQLSSNYIQIYRKSSIKDITAPVGVAQAYDAMHLLALAIKKAKSFDRIKVKKALENILIYKGALKTYKKPFDSINHEALDEEDLFMAKFADDGSIKPIRE
ncbi:DctP family TRAP transporter solute-binding subunit [Sulfurimonas sp.]